MRFVIVTGMSGAGKSSALKTLEDIGYFCVDNLPVALLDKFAKLTLDKTAKIHNVALGIDVRNGEGIGELETMLDKIRNLGISPEILYLNASNRILLKRYKETRRNHPLSRDGRVEDGIEKEREAMKFLMKQATYVIDTSHLLIRELKEEINHIYVDGETNERFQIAVVSFGFKYGIPADVDLVFDVRFLPNPYYDLKLRPLTGNDKPIQDFVMKYDEAVQFLEKLDDMMEFLIPNYIKEGKYNLVIGIGCTGGKHRSVTITNALAEKLSHLPYFVKVEHRDIMR
ncbi:MULTISPECIES: RNase adapter RapZ [Anaerostipes]|uniref:RNase adapter RapZ n=1 Tax=Anaerostipes TaxID=207244 RepID=UPI00258CEE48|nr:RNase adapter RapZ [Anaerostipes sp.]MCI5623472.1 RNase adapter RapZ [Anaerostipes sp.]MDY2726466.1 RNase adapter RapZ [Anaerostipes faecalis]